VDVDPCLDARVAAPAHPFPADRLTARRAAALESIRPGIAVWAAGWAMADADGDPAREDSEFYYLTGLETTDAWLVMVAPETGEDRVVLYVDTTARAGGATGSSARAREATAVADVRCLEDAALELPAMVSAADSPARTGRLYLSSTILDGTDPRVLATVDTTGISIGATGAHLVASRMVKDEEEQARVRHAARVTAGALLAAMRATRPGIGEADVEAVIEGSMHDAGAERMGFPSIVASGANALTLHYDRNASELQAGDLLLMDVGAESARYTGDVTRTIPVSGRFSDRQRALYDLVLGAQEAAVAALRPGITPVEVDAIARARMREEGGNLCGARTCDTYFVHFLSHHLGLDVHDPGSPARTLEPGMIVTIEPGLYLPDEGIGIRIEDDYLITPAGTERLSTGVPRTVAEIEAAMAKDAEAGSGS
jgi:Xaa-Pro aminopeptidase